jgi:SAM-dependent methyltransferase
MRLCRDVVVLGGLAMKISNQDVSFDSRPTLSRLEAREVYDAFAEQGHKQAGKDADSGYGGPAVTALLEVADFGSAAQVLDYGCGQGKLAELVLSCKTKNTSVFWRGIDQSPKMVQGFQQRCVEKFGSDRCSIELLENGDPTEIQVTPKSVDRFVSTYCLDLLSEEDMYKVLDLAEQCLDPDRGLLLLAGISWGYRSSIKTFTMTAVWELLYKVKIRKVGGCRPQALQPYLEARGWRIEKCVETMPNGYPWMVSEVIVARPPLPAK